MIWGVLLILMWSICLLWLFSRFPSPPIHICTFGFTVLFVWGTLLFFATDFFVLGSRFEQAHSSWLIPYGWVLGLVLFIGLYQMHKFWIKNTSNT